MVMVFCLPFHCMYEFLYSRGRLRQNEPTHFSERNEDEESTLLFIIRVVDACLKKISTLFTR